MEKILLVMILITSLITLASLNDRRRIREHILERGGQVVSIHWAPFGPEWFNAERAIIYRVDLLDTNGESVSANCKVPMFRGVRWIDKSPFTPV